MTTGEKIKYFRNMRGISQETLGQLSGINSATIKKYEYGIRNPKPDQLLKIANALGISINIFMDFDIETVSDVLSLLFKLDDQIDMKFEADKDDEGNFKPATVKLSFKNNLINKKLCTYMKALEIRENMINAKMNIQKKSMLTVCSISMKISKKSSNTCLMTIWLSKKALTALL